MAVSQMQRVRIFAHSSHRASLLKDLQELEIIHINNIIIPSFPSILHDAAKIPADELLQKREI